MKALNVVLISFSLFVFANSFANERVQTITLEEVVHKVSNDNFEVLTNALRVYQAKENISVARGNLLPKLNIWKILGAIVEPIGFIEDIVPFLVPANWFRKQETKILYLAEKEGYRALWGNQVYTAKLLYYEILSDEAFQGFLEETAKELSELERIMVGQEVAGSLPKGSSVQIKIARLQLQQDLRDVRSLVNESKLELARAMGIPLPVALTLAPVNALDWSNLEPIIPEEFEFRTVDVSPERRQFDHIIRVLPLIKKEAMFSFLGASSSSRGLPGGMFDHLPITDGLGFGTGAAMRIVSTEKDILEIQREGIKEGLKRDLWNLATRYNNDIESHKDLTLQNELLDSAWKNLKGRLIQGEVIDLLTLKVAVEDRLKVAILRNDINLRARVLSERLKRLLFGGDYVKEPVSIEVIRGTVKP